jgi:hypothetical protein
MEHPERFLKPCRMLGGIIIIVTVFLEHQKMFFNPKRPSIKRGF